MKVDAHKPEDVNLSPRTSNFKILNDLMRRRLKARALAERNVGNSHLDRESIRLDSRNSGGGWGIELEWRPH
jgi:hypothetical protein